MVDYLFTTEQSSNIFPTVNKPINQNPFMDKTFPISAKLQSWLELSFFLSSIPVGIVIRQLPCSFIICARLDFIHIHSFFHSIAYSSILEFVYCCELVNHNHTWETIINTWRFFNNLIYNNLSFFVPFANILSIKSWNMLTATIPIVCLIFTTLIAWTGLP